jgi:threonine/homoserine/homoserine lactone efflux protein
VLEPYVSEFMTLTFVSLLTILVPGPDFVLVTRNAIFYSRRAAFFTVMGMMAGLTLHMSYLLWGLAELSYTSSVPLEGLRYVGAGYFFIMGCKSFLEVREGLIRGLSVSNPKPLSSLDAMRLGFLSNISNVSCVIFLMSLFSVLIPPTLPPLVQVGFCLWRIILSLLWFTLVIFFFSHPTVQTRLLKYGSWVKILVGILFCFLGMRLLLGNPFEAVIA